MTAIRRSIVMSAAGAMVLLAACFPASVSAAPEQTPVFKLSYELASFAPPAADQAPRAEAQATQDASADQPAKLETAAIDQASLTCMAKVVHHESRGQPRRGQIAVAQTLINRLKNGNGRFGNSICAVANQRGQFFDTSAYHPAENSDDWKQAVDVSREAMAGDAEPAAPGAMFFHAAYGTHSGFFRSRQQVATIGQQVFYR